MIIIVIIIIIIIIIIANKKNIQIIINKRINNPRMHKDEQIM